MPRREEYIKKKNTAVMVVLGIILFAIFISTSEFGNGLIDSLFGDKKAQTEIKPIISPTSDDKLQIYYFDIGQGDSQLIRIPKDSGGYFNMLVDAGEYKEYEKLKNYLNAMNIKYLDAAIVTHPHADHMGGMAAVIRDFDIGEFYMSRVHESQIPTTVVYEQMLDALTEKNMKITVVESGSTIPTTATSSINVFGPISGNKYDEINDYSVVFKLLYGENSFLFLGDAEKVALNDEIGSGWDFTADVLKVGHHGSNTSTTRSIMDAIRPRVAIISCEMDNSYGHPHKEALELLEKYKCEIHRTDKDGTILIEADGKSKIIITDEVADKAA